MNIKIKDRVFETNISVSNYIYFLQDTNAVKINNVLYEIKPSIRNFKTLYKIVVDKESLKSYFKELIDIRRSEHIFNDYSFLYPFQKQAVKKVLDCKYRGYIISLEQGLGKTLTSIVAANLYKSVKNIWIIVPASLLNQWQEEIKKWVKEDSIIYEGTKLKRHKLYEQCVDNKWNIISYETFKIDYKDNENLRKSVDNSFAIFDEATKLKNKKSQIYKLFKKINSFKFKLFLTGTPVSNGLFDINNITKLINTRVTGAISTYTTYKMEVIGWGPNAKVIPKLVGYKNLDLYVSKIDPIYFRKTKKDASPYLPKKNIININIKQTKLHKKIEKEIIKLLSPFEGFTLLEILECGIEVFEKSNSENVQILKQVIKGKIVNPKINILKDLLYEINNQVLIFSRFKNSCYNIKKELQKEFKDKKIAIVESKTINKNQIAQDFREGKIDIVVATDTWAKGISFPDIDYMINFDVSPSYETYLQKQDRIHRLNSTTPKFIYNIVGDIVEKHILNLLNKKKYVANLITDGKSNKIDNIDIKNGVVDLLNWK